MLDSLQTNALIRVIPQNEVGEGLIRVIPQNEVREALIRVIPQNEVGEALISVTLWRRTDGDGAYINVTSQNEIGKIVY